MILSYFSQAQLLTQDSEQIDLFCLFSAVAAKEPQLGASLTLFFEGIVFFL